MRKQLFALAVLTAGALFFVACGATGWVKVSPPEIDDVLRNPGMGLADFQFAKGAPPLPGMHPVPAVAYFRWNWKDLEPADGRYDFEMVDNVLREAGKRGETLAFRIMTVNGDAMPAWLLEKGLKAVVSGGGDVFPDHNDPLFLKYHDRLLRAFGARYAGNPAIDHVDIGSVGCWGEWNTACCWGENKDTCKSNYPSVINRGLVVDQYVRHFPGTPLVIPAGGPTELAASRGTGWRGDCFGDFGMFRPGWSHMINVYEKIARNPVTGQAWKSAPVQFEVCFFMQDWFDRGADIDAILGKGLEWHMSVLNAKSSPVPALWRAKVDAFLKKIGYRFVLKELTHSETVSPGGVLAIRSLWENKGVAPIYRPWPLAYRLRSEGGGPVANWVSEADLKTWLPGTHEAADVVRVPEDLPPGEYPLEVAILTEDASAAHVEIAIAGRRPDKWYRVSTVKVRK